MELVKNICKYWKSQNIEAAIKHAISPTFFVSGDRRQFEGNLRRPERRSNIVFEAIYQVSEPW